MRDSFVSMHFIPSYDEMVLAIREGFACLKGAIPTVTMELVGPVHRDPYVKGDSEEKWCWISIGELPEDERAPSSEKYIAAVSTRGDDLFAAMVLYSLCKKFGYSIDDNAGYISAGKLFSFSEFEQALQARLGSHC
jgi:hypothetical protein